ncbi:MAG: hypothetical protein EBQ95_05965, partial [Gammaproteobacteria bacterium]|nr:hypothetical protein [Gammaproteobacteria bacterium]
NLGALYPRPEERGFTARMIKSQQPWPTSHIFFICVLYPAQVVQELEGGNSPFYSSLYFLLKSNERQHFNQSHSLNKHVI